MIAVVISACDAPGSGPVGPGPNTHGELGDTWTRDGGAWQQHQVARPAPRYLASLAYDGARHDYVLFGGQTLSGTSGDTWTWDGKAWRQLHPAHDPPPRRGAAMAYDASRREIVLYGGLVPDNAEGTVADDTWTWDGNDWKQIGPPDGAPGRREGATLVDTPDGLLLFGGRDSNVMYYGDAWRMRGSAWSRVATNVPTGPPGRANAAVAWDWSHQSLVVFGGSGRNVDGGPGAQGVPLTDTWLLTPPGWVAVIPSGPGSTFFANAVWDARAQRVLLLFGMSCPNPMNTVWAWNGAAWSQLSNAGPSPRWGAAVAADDSGNLLVFGGDDEPGC